MGNSGVLKMSKRGTTLERFTAKVVKTPGCWIWNGLKTKRGYGRLYYDGCMRYAHRVSLVLFKGYDIDSPLDTLHSCDNPQCVNPDHLSYGTRKQNMMDASLRGRTVNVNDWRGTKNPKAKLTASSRADVESKIRSGVRTGLIASEFNISTVRVQQIAKELRSSN
jgi:hypothetical protein